MIEKGSNYFKVVNCKAIEFFYRHCISRATTLQKYDLFLKYTTFLSNRQKKRTFAPVKKHCRISNINYITREMRSPVIGFRLVESKN